MRLILRIIICIYSFSNVVFGQNRDTILVSKDSITGIRKNIHLHYEKPNITKREITKYNTYGQLIYQSAIVSTLTGCIRNTLMYEVKAINHDGSYQTLKNKKRGGFVLKKYDKNGKCLSSQIIKYSNAIWLDVDENRFIP